MSEFKLDTSGVVLKRVADIPGIAAAQFHSIHWTNLDPFTQGFVEALFASLDQLQPPTAASPTDKREWVMDYMARNSRSRSRKNYNTGTTYDDGADFCEAFAEAFPGRNPDPNLRNASKRLAALLLAMWRDGQVERGLIGNEKYLPQEPSWQYVYSLSPGEHARRYEAIHYARCQCGALSHVNEAACLDCGRTKRWAQPLAFSDLAPEALRLGLERCGLRAAGLADLDAEDGRLFWHEQQDGLWVAFPPVTVALNDAGKVVFS